MDAFLRMNQFSMTRMTSGTMSSSIRSIFYFNQQGFKVGFDYVDDTEDIDVLKSTVKKIFEAMGQGQHYRTMMENLKV